MLQYVLGSATLTDEEFFQGDINEDGLLNILDVVGLVNIILNT